MKKIIQVEEHTTVRKLVGEIMYGKGLHVDDNPVDLALQHLDNIANNIHEVHEWHMEGKNTDVGCGS